jgi:hypothetical protein
LRVVLDFDFTFTTGRVFTAVFFLEAGRFFALALDFAATFAFEAECFRAATFFALANFLSFAMSESP